jgi:hypothetical protein
VQRLLRRQLPQHLLQAALQDLEALHQQVQQQHRSQPHLLQQQVLRQPLALLLLLALPLQQLRAPQ